MTNQRKHIAAASQLDGALPGCFATDAASQVFGFGATLALAGRVAPPQGCFPTGRYAAANLEAVRLSISAN